MQPDYPIRTKRLLLRPFTRDDQAAYLASHSRPDVMRYLYEEPLTPEQSAASVERRISRFALHAEGDALSLVLEQQDTGAMLGDVMLLWTSAVHRQGEVGFVLHPDYYGQGYAREASEAVMQWGFTVAGLHRIVGRCDARNTASATLLQRLGMRQEALFRQNEFVKGEWCDEAVYAILATEWAALHPSA